MKMPIQLLFASTLWIGIIGGVCAGDAGMLRSEQNFIGDRMEHANAHTLNQLPATHAGKTVRHHHRLAEHDKKAEEKRLLMQTMQGEKYHYLNRDM